MAVKLAVVAAGLTTIDAGTERSVLLLLIVTDDPPVGAGGDTVIVQFEAPFETRPAALQEMPETDGT